MVQLRLFAIVLSLTLVHTISAGVFDTQDANQLNNLDVVFLGTFNGKNWWLDQEPVVQPAANAYCGVMGFKLATIDNLQEFEWLYNRTVDVNGYGDIWTAGKNIQRPEAFNWHYVSNDGLDSAIPFRGFDDMMERSLGLVLSTGMRCLAPKVITSSLPFLCNQYVSIG